MNVINCQRGASLAESIASALQRRRFRLDNEKLLQGQVEQALSAGGFSFSREHRLGPSDVIDFLAADVGIEAKIKGQGRAIFRQCERYCAHDAIAALIAITNAAMGFPPEIQGKPIYVVNLGKAWLG